MGSLDIFILASGLACFVSTPVARKLALLYRFVDEPGHRKVHRRSVPRIGGAAVVLGVLTGIALLVLLGRTPGRAVSDIPAGALSVVGGGLVMFAVGLWDDIRGLAAWKKLAVQIACAATVCALGVRLEAVEITPSLTIALGWASWPLGILWIVAFVNAANLIDGLDGLASGLATIAAAALFLLAVRTGQPGMALFFAATCASLIAFLYFNFHPARIYLGDGGSLFLGFVLGAGSLACIGSSSPFSHAMLPVLAMAIPLADTGFSIVRRLLDGRSPLQADDGHIHHRLLRAGLSHRRAVVLLWAAGGVFAAMGLVLLDTPAWASVTIGAASLIAVAAFFRYAGAIRFRAAWRAHVRRREGRVDAIEDRRVPDAPPSGPRGSG
jgi:UDP-GlcNAc:undecaprenyl-phosphate GlcNAc-1-phosphate transferase